MKKRRRGLAGLLAAALLTSLWGCGTSQRRSVTWYTYFDTVTTVTGYGSERQFRAACDIIEDVLLRYHRATDIYHEYSGVVNARTVNLRAGAGPVSPAPELMEVLTFGREVYDLTEGQCDIALGAVLSLWHERREAALSGETPRLPEETALKEAGRHCDIRDLILDPAAGTAELRDSAMSLDLGAVAKGYAAEKAAAALRSAGYTGYAINLGGNVRTLGTKPGGEPWAVGIQNPAGQGDLLRLKLADAALVTSGSYQRYYTVDGVDYHHIISPETLYPRNDYLSVTVLTGDSGLADALSTGLFNMDLKTGMNYVNQMEGTEACWVLADGEVVYSDGFEAYILP